MIRKKRGKKEIEIGVLIYGEELAVNATTLRLDPISFSVSVTMTSRYIKIFILVFFFFDSVRRDVASIIDRVVLQNDGKTFPPKIPTYF